MNAAETTRAWSKASFRALSPSKVRPVMVMLRLEEGDQRAGSWGKAVGRRVPSGKQAEGGSLPPVSPRKIHRKAKITSDIVR